MLVVLIFPILKNNFHWLLLATDAILNDIMYLGGFNDISRSLRRQNVHQDIQRVVS